MFQAIPAKASRVQLANRAYTDIFDFWSLSRFTWMRLQHLSTINGKRISCGLFSGKMLNVRKRSKMSAFFLLPHQTKYA